MISLTKQRIQKKNQMISLTKRPFYPFCLQKVTARTHRVARGCVCGESERDEVCRRDRKVGETGGTSMVGDVSELNGSPGERDKGQPTSGIGEGESG